MFEVCHLCGVRVHGKCMCVVRASVCTCVVPVSVCACCTLCVDKGHA